MSSLSDQLMRNIELVNARIASAAARAGRGSEEITLVAVTKTVAAPVICEAVALGLRRLGENRVEDAEPRMAQVRVELAARGIEPPVWHMIGHVQSRKAARVAVLFGCVQSVDSMRLARRLDEARVDAPDRLPVLLEINTSGEESKSGLAGHRGPSDGAQCDGILAAAEQIAGLPRLRVEGLMTVGPLGAPHDESRRAFARLREWQDALRAAVAAADWRELSMGMTDDLDAAILEGSTMVRVGRALFRMESS
jgi:PLP dependent protein